ncbi:D-glycero-alpha-D-manno-heptose-1,7-bisphosphate 7-phosphatase [Mucisphaera calidilacus]|uniref:D,D-heptose 1,7-bisphosphate phosphatase n=1 Tax=Mucisphaera calidilacus TaxID=2527982 RepID=A0A518BUP7_9BACT|nr:HAD family hydrolase [Mucisphaera calidilacus]QDU70709.1 D-glycero-alpha-D-manno-heptose-1,7-bisphosphate 7-phosphatase [Mucisphaera calidilacus]
MIHPGPGWPTRHGSPAVFLDRDGTLIEDRDYLADPDGVVLLPGVIEGLQRLRDAGFTLAIATNQSGIGRGLMTHDDVDACHRRLIELLEPHDIRFAAIGSCPLATKIKSRRIIESYERKPGPGMLITIAREHGIDLLRSWMVGDAERDLIAGRHAGCRGTILVDTGRTREIEDAGLIATARVPTFNHAVDRILAPDSR